MSFLGSLFRRSSSLTVPSQTTHQTKSEVVEEGLDLALSFLETGAEVEQNLCSPSGCVVPQPITTPTSKLENTPTSEQISSTLRKVTFESIRDNDFHYSSSPSRVLSPLRPLPASLEKPAKSILKPFKPSSLNTVIRKPFASFTDMLENIVKQLAAGDERGRIDAYQAFLSAIQAKISVPEQDALLDASPSLLEFIFRDVQHPSAQNLQIATWALKFLATLTRMIPVAEQPDFDGLASLLDLSIDILEKLDASKTIIQHHMLFVGQKLHPKLMSVDRATRILISLSKIHEKVPGNVVKVYRLVIYQQFLEHMPNVMLSRPEEWLPNIFNCFISNKSEVRRHALNLGTTASLRHAKALHKTIYDMLESRNEESSFNDLFVQKLHSLLDHKDREMAQLVPRIWAIIMFFLRPKFNDKDFWAWFRPWLQLLSKAMNSTDRQVKVEAFMAWKRCIYAVMPDKTTKDNVRKMLRHPFLDGLMNQRELQQGLGRSIMSGYLCLLYYSLRPMTSFECLDVYWEDYVSAVLKLFTTRKHNGQHIYYAASILQALFQSTEKWNEERANTIQAFEIDELCRIDPIWIRSRLSKVLLITQSVMSQSSSWTPIDDVRPDQEQDAYSNNLATGTWSALMDSVKEAGSKEITASTGLKSSIAAIMNTLHATGKWLQQHPPPTLHPAQAFQLLATCSISRLGSTNFVEKILSKNPDSEDFEIAATPSHRNKVGQLQSAITQLLEMQIELISEDVRPNVAVNLVQAMILQCYNAMSARTTKLNLLADLLESLDRRYSKKDIPQVVLDISDHLMRLAEELTRPVLGGLTATSLNSKDFEAILSLNRHFISVRGTAPETLYKQAADAAKRTNGAGGLLLAVTEPHAGIIHQLMSADNGDKYNLLLTCTNFILANDVRPRNWGAVERGRKSLYGGITPSNGTAKAPDLEYTKLSSLANYALRYGYAQLNPAADAQLYSNLFKVLIEHLNRIPPTSCSVFLRHIQAGICCVLTDSDFYIRDFAEDRGKQSLVKEILSFWQTILTNLQSQSISCLPNHEDVILAGLTSPRETIVNHTISFWNELIQHYEEPIECPESIVDAVKQLSRISTIRLPPSMEVDEDIDANPVTSYFDYSQRTIETPRRVALPSSARRSSRKSSPNPVIVSSGRISRRHEIPRKKPRHEDSQIHFEVIESSPIVQETQNLTERQREVAERQQSNGTMFIDIHNNSPLAERPTTSKLNSPVQELESELSNQSDDMVGSSDREEPQSSPPSSPTFGPNHVQSDDKDRGQDQPQSSPLVASVKRKRGQSLRGSNELSDAANAAQALTEEVPVYDMPSSPPSARGHRSHDLMDSHLTEETDVINSTTDNTQVEEHDHHSTPTIRSQKSSLVRLKEAFQDDLTARTSSSKPVARHAQLHSEIQSHLDETEEIRPNVTFVDVPRSASELDQQLIGQKDMEISAVEDSFVLPTGSISDIEVEDTPMQIRVNPTPHIEIEVTPASESQDDIADSQTSQQSTISVRSSQQTRRRKMPFGVVDEILHEDGLQPCQKKRKSAPTRSRQSQPVVISSAQTTDKDVQIVDIRSVTESLVVDSFASASVVVLADLQPESSPARAVQPGVPTSKSIVERLRDLVAEAGSAKGWGPDEQREIADLTFELQALSRGR